MKYFLASALLVILAVGCASVISRSTNDESANSAPCSPKLGESFGTIYELKVEILDGDHLNRFAYKGNYLMRVLKINGTEINDSLVIWFKDESGDFPTEGVELYEKFKKEETGSSIPVQFSEMEQSYVGNTYNIIAYESGEFVGDPEGYSNYRPTRQSVGFHFRNYLQILSNMSNKEENR